MTPFHESDDVRSPRTRGGKPPPAGHAAPAGRDLARESEIALYLGRLFLPICRTEGTALIVTSDPGPENAAWLRAAYGAVRIVGVPRRVLLSNLSARFGSALSDDATFGLAREHPSLSALEVATFAQRCVLLAAGTALGALLCAWPAPTLDVLVAGASLLFWAIVLFRGLLALLGGGRRPGAAPAEIPDSGDTALPPYTVIVPLYREANMVPSLVRSLCALRYPPEKLQLILAVEDDDAETADAAEAAAQTGALEVVRVPAAGPRTKPKAANFALRFARGDFVVIYDAEDQPEPDQLLKAVAGFRSHPRTTACLQARLSFYNRSRWITRQAALDYELWFGYLLPGLERLGMPMPLGGTSNHFRTSVLRAIRAWDPFNVTEDADIGIRLAALGYRVAMLDSTTHEEAPEDISAWIKQRSRWLKGYMQTWLVHSRCMPRFAGQAGLRGCLTFHLFIGGTVLSALLNPILWLTLALSVVFAPAPGGHHYGTFSGASLLASNLLLTILAMAGSRGGKGDRLGAQGLMVALYWLLISVAGYRGLWHLLTKPFHWEKTAHGLTGGHGGPAGA